MKPIINAKWILIACLIVVAGGLFIRSGIAAKGEHKGVLTYIEGVVDVQKAGSTQWVPAEKGMELAAGDSIRTTIDSVADIALEDGSSLRLSEEAEMTIDALSTQEQKARFLYFFNKPVEADTHKLKLVQGTVLASVKKLSNSQSKFEVETPKGVAGVRGTSWYVGSSLGVAEGFIDWSSKKPNPTPGPLDDFLQRLKDLLAGRGDREGGQPAGSPVIRINEGMKADIDDNGQLINWGVVPEQVLTELRDFYRERYNEPLPAPVSQRDANTYVEQQSVPANTLDAPLASGTTTSIEQRDRQTNPDLGEDTNLTGGPG